MQVGNDSKVPPVPGVLALSGLLFFKPLTMHRMLGQWHSGSSPPKGRKVDHIIVPVVARGALLLFAIPFAVVIGLGLALELLGHHWIWRGAFAGVAVGLAIGAFATAIASIALRVVAHTLAGVALGVVGGTAIGSVLGVIGGLDDGNSDLVWAYLLIGIAGGATGNTSGRLALGSPGRVSAGALVGIAIGAVAILIVGYIPGLAIGLGTIAGVLRLPLFLAYCLVCAGIRLRIWHSGKIGSLHSIVPTRIDEVIYFPLPFLRSALLTSAKEMPELGVRMLEEASLIDGQRDIASSTLHQLQIDALTEMAFSRDWSWPTSPFVPSPDSITPEDKLYPFTTTAENLDAVTTTQRAQQRRRRLLEGARSTLESARANIVTGRRHDRIWLEPIRLWLAAVERLEAQLAAETPEVPDVFQEGNRLNNANIDHCALFKGRRDLVAIIDRDLSAKQKAPLLLTGQRRMGKSSLLQMLPSLLGTIETVVVIDFQQLAGEPDRGNPHRILAQRLYAELPDLPPPPDAKTWGPTLTWMVEADAAFAARDHRVLLAIDEIERLQDGIEAGWAPPDFLDFLRAAGDRLAYIRLLLVSAHPIQRLGEVWCDRLISAIQRPIGPLEPDQACELLEAPIPEFPPIWPAGAVDRICRLTGHHPFLLQAVGNKVVQALNTRCAMLATDADVDRALDQVVNGPALFPNLWKERRDDERRLLRRLAGADEADSLQSRVLDAGEQTAAAWLHREGFIVDEGDGVRIATPLFATWIRVWGQAYA